MAITERPTLDRLAEDARLIASGGPWPPFTYIAEDTVKRRIACGAADSRSKHDEIECLASTLLESADADDSHHQAGVELARWIARRYSS